MLYEFLGFDDARDVTDGGRNSTLSTSRPRLGFDFTPLPTPPPQQGQRLSNLGGLLPSHNHNHSESPYLVVKKLFLGRSKIATYAQYGPDHKSLTLSHATLDTSTNQLVTSHNACDSIGLNAAS
jgi:hypothetical protein